MSELNSNRYFSVDVESSGPHPLKGSMLSLGACVIGDTSKTFYAELKPIRKKYDLETIKIGARKLNSLVGYDFSKFNPEEVLEIIKREGEEPIKVMGNFDKFIKENSAGRTPVMCAAPIKFDGAFTSHYFFSLLGYDPFGHTGKDMGSMLAGFKHNLRASLKELGIREESKLTHNALEDAVQQAKEFYVLLYFMGEQDKI